MRTKFFAVLLAGVLLFAGAATASSKATTSTHSCLTGSDIKPPSDQTLEISFQALRPFYRAGDTVKALVVVKRRVDVNGVREATSRPAADVNVAIGLTLGETYMTGSAITDADGKALVSINTWDDLSSGWAHAKAIAWKEHSNAICHTKVEEYGKSIQERFVKIRS